jgi:peptidoglycan/LPS O-acetylase OafA/YrhL
MRVTSRREPGSPDRIVPLDGVRALALLIVIGFHFGLGWLQGGFFSLDLFFVLSGFLITGLLVSEYRRRGGIVLSAFWLRRARRLLPCLVLVLVAVTLCVRFLALPGTYPGYRMSGLSALFYFSNWWQIANSSSYFVVTGAVSPLTHTWSLAVEEQFYLVWPLVVLAVLWIGRSYARGLRILLAVSVVGAVASAVEMALLYRPTVDTTRLYFGTDTHAQSILIGAAIACVMAMIQDRRGETGLAPRVHSAANRRLLAVVGVVGLAGVAVLTYTARASWAVVYQGGFAVSALASGAIIVSVVCVAEAPVGRLLSVRPVVWLGTISYGAYLWHFPVYVFLSSARTGLTGAALMAIQFATTVIVAAISFYVIERPVMRGTFWRSLKAAVPAVALTVATVGVIFVGTEVSATAVARPVRFRPTASSPSARATTPPKVVVLGDSTALTLAEALSATAPTGTTVISAGNFGCGLAMGTSTSDNPPTVGLAMFPACNQTTAPQGQWPARDATAVRGAGPDDVVLFVAGDWEVADILMSGHWTNILAPSFQRYEMNQMRRVIRIGTAHGSHFELFTMPAEDNAEAMGEPIDAAPEDSLKRKAIYNGLLRKVAAEFPGRVSVVDYGSIISPKGVFTTYIGGVQVRAPDGVHTPSYAPGNPFSGNSTQQVAEAFYNWLSPRIWPRILDPVTPGHPITP